MTIVYTGNQRAKMTEALQNVKARIEEENEELTVSQACVIYDICTALEIDAKEVLGKDIDLIESGNENMEALELGGSLAERPGLTAWWPEHREEKE